MLLALAALITTCFVLWQANAITTANLETSRLELKQANEKIEIQLTTILNMQRDAQVQQRLLETANTNISAIRAKAQDDIQALTQRDLGKDANTDALALQSAINGQFQRYLDNIKRFGAAYPD